jgi:hypothetical protein
MLRFSPLTIVGICGEKITECSNTSRRLDSQSAFIEQFLFASEMFLAASIPNSIVD